MNWQSLQGFVRRLAENTQSPSDAELLQRFVQAREEDAFAALVRRRGPMVLGVCRRVLRDHHEAEDAFQATFLVLARKAHAITQYASLGPWLHRVAIRIALRARRKRIRVSPVAVVAELPTEETDNVWSGVLDEEIDRLPERLRTPFVLCYREGRTYAEASDDLGCSEATVNRRLARAREWLRSSLTRRGVTPAVAATLLVPVVSESVAAEVSAALAHTACQFLDPRQTALVADRVHDLIKGEIKAMSYYRVKMVAALALLGLGLGGMVWLYSAPVDPSSPQEKPRREPPRPVQVRATDMQALVRDNNAFAVDMFHQVRRPAGNLFFSPLSVSSALGMTYAGARGDTAVEMEKALHFTLGQDRLHPTLGKLMSNLSGTDKARPYQLHLACSLWGQEGMAFRDEFLTTQRNSYGADLRRVNFARNPSQARETINRWVEQQTREKIKDLLPPNSVTASSRLALVSAVYFQGNWEYPFDSKQTREDDFHIGSGKKVKAQLMSQAALLRTYDAGSFQALELPYKGKDLSMVVLLPKRVDGLSELEKGMTAAKLDEVFRGLDRPALRYVYLPRFRTTAPLDLAPVLQGQGMRKAFEAGEADFSGIDGRRHLYVSAALHKGFVEVNELGTEAAAATAIVLSDPSLPPLFRADHPFLYLIRDNGSGSILFLGRLVDPTK